MSFIAATTGMTKEAADAQPSAVEDLKKAKEHSDAKRYDQKHAVLRKLITMSPQDFYVDAPGGAHPGLTHSPSGFRIHAPRSIAALAGGAEKAASAKGFKEALRKAGVPGDMTFYTDGKERATVATGDWHDQQQCDAAYAIGKKFFKQWETPDDSEIGRPSWATSRIVSGVSEEDSFKPEPRKCSRCGLPSKHEQCGDCERLDENDTASVDYSNDPLFARYGAPSKQEEKIQARLGDAGRCPHGVRTPMNTCDECGTKSAKLREDKLERLRQRRGECEHCGEPNLDSACKCVESEGSPLFARFGVSEKRLSFDKQASTAASLRKAYNETHTHPTDGQKANGNYRKGRVTLHGLHIAIENPPGSTRSGVDNSGKKWESTLKCAYGYFVGTKAIDGDAVDCFIGPDPESEFVAVVAQNDSSGKFDELKVMLGYTNADAARKGYLANYPKGWESNIREVTDTTASELRSWLRSGKTTGAYRPPTAREKAASRVSGLASDEGQMSQPKEPSLRGLWGTRNNSVRALVSQLPGLLGRHVSKAATCGGRDSYDAGAERRQCGILSGELPLDTKRRTEREPQQQYPLRVSRQKFAAYGVVEAFGHPQGNAAYASKDSEVASGEGADLSGRVDASFDHALATLRRDGLSSGGTSKEARDNRQLAIHEAAEGMDTAGRSDNGPADKKRPFHDWDGTVIPRIPGGAKAYLEAIGALTPADVLPDGRGHTEPIDLATARPPLFHKHIRATAARLGVPVGEIHHAKGDKTELLKEHDRPIIDDDESIRASIRQILGDRYAIEPQKAAATEPKTSPDWGWALGGQAAGGLTIAGLLKAYSKLTSSVAGAPADREDRGVMRKLKDDIRATPEFGARHSVVERMGLRRGDTAAAANHLRAAGIGRSPEGSHYDGVTGKINLSKGLAGPAVLAHELGHKQGPKSLLPARGIGQALSNLAAFGVLAAPDQETSRNMAIAGSVASTATLASELDASMRGYKLLRVAGSSKARALKAFIGLPTYALMSGIPALSYAAKKHSGGFNPPSETVKQASGVTDLLRRVGLSQAPLLGEEIGQQARKGVSLFNVSHKGMDGPLSRLLRHPSVAELPSGNGITKTPLKDGVAVDFAGALHSDWRDSAGLPKKIQPLGLRTPALEKALRRAGKDKAHEAQFFSGLLPETISLDKVLEKHRVQPGDSRGSFDALRREFGGEFVAKPKGGYATAASALATDQHGPERLQDMLTNGIANNQGKIFKGAPSKFVAQPRLDLQPLSQSDKALNNLTEMAQQRRWGGIDAALGKSDLPFQAKGSLSGGKSNEFRVHVIDGKVIPYATSARGSVTGVLPWYTRQAKAAENALAQKLQGVDPAKLKGTFAFDVAPGQKGNWHVIESNPTDGGGSGLMGLPHMQDAVAAALQGRLPNYVKTQRGIQGAGLAALGAGAVALRGSGRSDDTVS